MAQPETGPKYYSLERLLSQTVQPFPDLPPDRFAELKQSISDTGLLNPILLTEDGYLFDGHQRCKALIALGRVRLAASQVRVLHGVNRNNMLERAYTSNIVRRQVSTADKAAAMHGLVARGWAQRRIAATFGMSQPAVSQLMRDYPAEGEVPAVIITQGEDGKTYTRPSKPPRRKQEPWQYDGVCFRALRAARAKLRILPIGLTDKELVELDGAMTEFQEAIDQFLDYVRGETGEFTDPEDGIDGGAQ